MIAISYVAPSLHASRRLGTTLCRSLLRTGLVCLFVLACVSQAHALREIDWLELIPPDEVAELERLADSGQMDIEHDSDLPAPVFGSARTVTTMHGVTGKMPGYIVPLETDDRNRVTEFFLVPYYGACIHVPPPPPNQIVYVRPQEPIPDVEIWNPYWIEGTLHIQDQKNEVAAASYSFDAKRVLLYQ
ncbi:MAG: DUF3299 domain-containing protein [Pigmentiphaga sp.]